jgi:hypothetical protein
MTTPIGIVWLSGVVKGNARSLLDGWGRLLLIMR